MNPEVSHKPFQPHFNDAKLTVPLMHKLFLGQIKSPQLDYPVDPTSSVGARSPEKLVRAHIRGAVLALLRCPKDIQHGHRSSAGDRGGHHSIPFIHSGSLHLDSPQVQ